MSIKMIKLKNSLYIHKNKTTKGRSKSAETRWRNRYNRELTTAHSAFDGCNGGLHKAFIDRHQLGSLKSRSPLTTAGHAVSLHVGGNCRVDGFKTIEHLVGLYSFIDLMTYARKREEMQALKALLSRHFEASFASARIKEGTKPSACRCANRKLFMEIRPMRAEGLGFVPADKLVEVGYKHTLLRFTLMKGHQHEISHALLRCRPDEKHSVMTESEVFESAASQCLEDQPEGIFVCKPEHSASVAGPLAIEPTTRPVDAVEATAQFIVHSVKAYRKGSNVIVTLADLTGILDPLRLREAILKHPLKVEVSFAYLPCLMHSQD